MRHPSLSTLIITALLGVFIVSHHVSAAEVDLPRYPSVSPDGKTVAFSWRGDLWKVGIQGGKATRLSSHPSEELRSVWHPDGKRIAFNSLRSGGNNIYTMTADGSNIQQVTHTDQSHIVTGFAKDAQGREAISYYAWTEADAYYHARPFTVPTQGGASQRIHDAFGARPVISPDGKHTVFTRGTASWYRKHYRGSTQLDLWLYTHADKSFKQLTEWTGNDGKAQWLNNQMIVFLSDRQFNTVNLYRMNVTKGRPSVKRITNFKGRDIQDIDVSADGKTAVFTVWNKIYSLNLEAKNAKPKAIVIQANEDEADRFVLKNVSKNVTEAALSPDGKVMAVVAYGDVFIRSVDGKSQTQRVTETHAHEKDIAWSPDGARLYFTSDEDGTESIYEATVNLTRGEIKKGWVKKEVKEVEKVEKAEKKEEVKKKEATLPTDAKGDKKPTKTTTKDDPKKEDKPESPDKSDTKTDATKEEKPAPKIPDHLNPARWDDAVRFDVRPVVKALTNDREADPSPDGKHLAFRRGRGDLVILDRTTGKTRTLVQGWDTGLHWAWRPDGKLIAYCHSDRDFNYDIWLAPADGSAKPVNVTRHPDNEFNPSWSADGKWLNFMSERVNEEFDIWMVALDKSLDALPTPERDDYYKAAAAEAKKRKPIAIVVFPQDNPRTPAKKPEPKNPDTKKKDVKKEDAKKKEEAKSTKPVKPKTLASELDKLDLADAYLRLRRVTKLPGHEQNNLLMPAGDRFVYSGSDSYAGLWTAMWNGSGAKKIAGAMSVQHATLTGDKIIAVEKGRAAIVAMTGSVQYIDISATTRIDLQKQSSQKFLEAARTMGERFYHPTMKGLNWAKVTQRYAPLAAAARTSTEFDLVGNRLLGELNASHLSIRSPSESSPSALPVGYLGADVEPTKGGFRVTALLEDGPAATSLSPLKVGDAVTAVELSALQPADTLEKALEGRLGKETIITVNRKIEGKSQAINLLITPTSFSAIRSLKYDAWRKNNAAVVAKLSNDRLGYIHIRSMNQSSLDEYERDLYAAAHGRKGLIVDVRNNGGGWTTDRLLASIMNTPHAYTVPRGADPKHKDGYPQDRLFIQRYSLPMNTLCNERSISNAEIISHAFKTLKRGTLVGQTTYGGVISTGRTSLIDGTSLSLPFRGWYLPDGTDMENNGAVPDLLVPQTPQAEAAGKDEQLETAVKDLLKRIK